MVKKSVKSMARELDVTVRRAEQAQRRANASEEEAAKLLREKNELQAQLETLRMDFAELRQELRVTQHWRHVAKAWVRLVIFRGLERARHDLHYDIVRTHTLAGTKLDGPMLSQLARTHAVDVKKLKAVADEFQHDKAIFNEHFTSERVMVESFLRSPDGTEVKPDYAFTHDGKAWKEQDPLLALAGKE